ncbi:hypothetical protein Vafri_8439 [Volvox africanus]|nr:hypothetical protein Vafri_8439 [Volvox africanus]
MRAIICENLGDARTPLGKGVLKLAEVPKPELAPGTVRIQVASSSLNFPDALQIKGEYQDKPKLPFIPGSEVSGVVVEVADGVKNLQVGDKVCAVRQGGAFAEQVVAPAASVWRVPGQCAACGVVLRLGRGQAGAFWKTCGVSRARFWVGFDLQRHI